MKKSLISIIIPIYNKEKLLKKCIESVINQTYDNLEIILVDDGSTDKSAEMCDLYKKEDERIVVIHKRNGGLSDARNKGIECSKGEYLFFLDADDYLSVDTIEVLYKRIEEEKADIAICNFAWIDQQGKEITASDVIKDEVLDKTSLMDKLLGEKEFFYVVAWNKLYSRKIFNYCSFELGKVHEDEFIVHQVFEQCDKAVSVSKILYYYIQTENSITTSEFNIKRLDYMEALYQRILYFKVKNYKEHKQHALKLFWWCCYELYVKVSITSENIERMRELKKYYDVLFWDILAANRRNVITILECMIFRVNPRWYNYIKVKRNRVLR